MTSPAHQLVEAVIAASKLGTKTSEARGKLVEQIDLLDQATDRLSNGVEHLARGVLRVFVSRQRRCVFFAESVKVCDKLLLIDLVECKCLA